MFFLSLKRIGFGSLQVGAGLRGRECGRFQLDGAACRALASKIKVYRSAGEMADRKGEGWRGKKIGFYSSPVCSRSILPSIISRSARVKKVFGEEYSSGSTSMAG